MIISNLIGQNQAQQAAEAQQDAQDVQSQAAIYDHMMRDPNVPIPLKAAALKHGMGLLEEHGGKHIQDQLPQFGQQLGNLVQQSAQRGALNKLVAMAQRQGALPPGMPGRPAPTPMTSPLPEWMKGPATPPDQGPGQGQGQAGPNAPPPGTNLEYWNGPGGASLQTLAGLPRTEQPPPGAGIGAALPGGGVDAGGAPSLQTLAGLPTRGVPQEAWRASLKPESPTPPHITKRQRVADILGRIAMATGYRSPEQQAMIPLRAQLMAQHLEQQQRISDLNDALVKHWITPEQFEEARRDIVMGVPVGGGPGARQRVNLTYPDGSNVVLSMDRSGRFYNVANQEVHPPQGAMFAEPTAVTAAQEAEEEAEAIADAIEARRQSPDLSGLARSGVRGRVQKILEKRGYNLMQAQLDLRAVERYIASANGDRQLKLRQATTFAFESLELLDNSKNPGSDLIGELRQKLPMTDVPVINKAVIKAAANNLYGTEAQSIARRIMNQIGDLQAELSTVYMGGNSSTDMTLEQARKQLEADWSENTLRDNIKLIRRNLGIRLNSISSTGPVYWQMGGAPAGGAGGAGAGGGRFGGVATPTIDTQADYNALPHGAHYIDKQDGKEYIKQ